jgi:hypothetical protein
MFSGSVGSAVTDARVDPRSSSARSSAGTSPKTTFAKSVVRASTAGVVAK